MKNLSDFKKRILKGVKIHTTYHQAAKGRDEKGLLILADEDKGNREVNIVQGNAFTLLTTKKDGSISDSWLHFPKASEIKIVNENTIQILAEDFRMPAPERENAPLIPLLTYTFI